MACFATQATAGAARPAPAMRLAGMPRNEVGGNLGVLQLELVRESDAGRVAVGGVVQRAVEVEEVRRQLRRAPLAQPLPGREGGAADGGPRGVVQRVRRQRVPRRRWVPGRRRPRAGCSVDGEEGRGGLGPPTTWRGEVGPPPSP